MILEITDKDHIVNYPGLLLKHIKEISVYTPNTRMDNYPEIASLRINEIKTITIICNDNTDERGWIYTSEYKEILKFFFSNRIDINDIESIIMSYILGRFSPFTKMAPKFASLNHIADYYELHIKFKYKKNGEDT